jgi:hypothetical protein
MNAKTSAVLQIAGSDGTRTLGTAMDAKQIKDISKALADETQLAMLKAIAARKITSLAEIWRACGELRQRRFRTT